MLDLKQVTGDIEITITWSEPHPEMTGKLISAIAAEWGVTQQEAGKRLQPAGAVYHNMSEDDRAADLVASGDDGRFRWPAA